MYTSPTLTIEEFKLIHNGLCKLNSAINRLEDVVHPNIYQDLVSGKDEIYKGLKNSYNVEENYFDIQSKHYGEMKKQMNLTSIWSKYEVQDLLDKHTYGNVDRLVYKNNWGKYVSVSIQGNTWLQLYRASDQAIKESNDLHHVFIEDFSIDENDNRTLCLHTGS